VAGKAGRITTRVSDRHKLRAILGMPVARWAGFVESAAAKCSVARITDPFPILPVLLSESVEGQALSRALAAKRSPSALEGFPPTTTTA
jgi:hypothetical protein